MKRYAYEDNAGGLMVVDYENQMVAWTDAPQENALKDDIKSDLTDWSQWANSEENSLGDRHPEENRELNFFDYTNDIEKFTPNGGIKLIAICENDNLETYPNAMGYNAKKWAGLLIKES
jgi:hypothetical protein